MSDTGYALSASGAISRVLMKHIATRIVGLCEQLATPDRGRPAHHTMKSLEHSCSGS